MHFTLVVVPNAGADFWMDRADAEKIAELLWFEDPTLWIDDGNSLAVASSAIHSRMDMRRLVGRNFRRLRIERGLTQEEVAELSGFSQQYISGLEAGKRNPTIVTIYELAVALGVSHVALVTPETFG